MCVKEGKREYGMMPDKKATSIVSDREQNTRSEKHLLPFYLALLNGLLVYSIPLVTDLKRMKRTEKNANNTFS